MVSALWDREMRKLLDWERNAGEALRRSIEQATGRYATERTRIDERREGLMSMKDDPVIFVRYPGGPPVKVYHARTYCGWCPSPHREMLLSDAKADGLHACSSCGYAVASAA